VGTRAVGVTDQPSAAGVADVRARERTDPVLGTTVAEQYVIPISERVASFKGMATSFRMPGRAATAQNLFAIFNASGSTVLVAVRRLSFQMDVTTALTAVAKQIKTSRITAVPTNGTALSKVAVDSAQTSSANVTVWNDASADGTSSATTLTATPGTAGWQQFAMRMHTAAGQVLMDDEAVVPLLSADDPVILRASEGLLVSVVAAATTSNPTTDQMIVQCMFEEFTLP
jgi:hypothetical protein